MIVRGVAFCVLLILGACDDDRFFQCGVKVSDDSKDFRVCDRDKEVCICARRSCAIREDVPGDCTSGFRYVNDEFSDPSVRGMCVEAELVAQRIEQTEGGTKSCELLHDAGVDAADGGVDAVTDSANGDAP